LSAMAAMMIPLSYSRRAS